MSKNEPGKWVTPNGYSCKGYTRDAPPRTCYSTESSSLPTYQNSHVTTGRRRADDYLSCNDSVSESYENGYLTKETLVSSESRRRGTSNEPSYSFVSKKSAPRKGCFDRHGQTIGFLICVGTILVGAGLGMYFGVQFAVGQPSKPVTEPPVRVVVVPTEGSGTITEMVITTKKPEPCLEYKENENYLQHFEKDNTCLCSSDLAEIDMEEGEKLLEKIKTKLSEADGHDNQILGLINDLKFSKKCVKGLGYDYSDCGYSTIGTDVGNCWIKNSDNKLSLHHSSREDCVKFAYKNLPLTLGWLQIESDSEECLVLNTGKDQNKFPLLISDCFDKRFRLNSANCDEENKTHFYFSNWSNTKCLDVIENEFINCENITSDHLLTKSGKVFKNSEIELKFDDETNYLKDGKKCKIYNPITNKIEKKSVSCEDVTIWE